MFPELLEQERAPHESCEGVMSDLLDQDIYFRLVSGLNLFQVILRPDPDQDLIQPCSQTGAYEAKQRRVVVDLCHGETPSCGIVVVNSRIRPCDIYITK